MRTTRRLNPIAVMEDETVAWYSSAAVGKLRALRAFAAESEEPFVLFDATPEHLRPWDHGDCDRAEPCECEYRREEGWMLPCSANHPAAVAVWRIEQVRDLWRTLERVRWRIRARRWKYRPVLWGARRHDNQLRLGEQTLRWGRRG